MPVLGEKWGRTLFEILKSSVSHGFWKMERGYSSKSVTPRDLPSDEEIVEARSKMVTPGWLWVYDAIAIYGLCDS